MNFKSLRAFIHVIEEGGLNNAALKMNLSQPAVSRLIQLLEEEAGVRFFDRSTKSLTPTPEAEAFYPDALQVVNSINEFPDTFARIRSKSLTPLTVFCHIRIVNGLVAPAMAKLERIAPSMRVKLKIYSRRELGRRILRDKFDLGVFTIPLQVVDVNPQILCHTALHVLLPKGHRLAGRTALGPADMADERYIALTRDTVVRQAIDYELMKTGEELKVFHEVSTEFAARRMVASGVGFVLTDPIGLEPDISERTVLIPWRPMTKIEHGFYVPKHQQLHEGARLLIDCLRDVCNERFASLENCSFGEVEG